jgi:hypothetical protein
VDVDVDMGDAMHIAVGRAREAQWKGEQLE